MSAQPADMDDAELLEYMIQHCYQQMLAGKTQDVQLHWWSRMGYYLRKRTPETIKQMEGRMGLA